MRLTRITLIFGALLFAVNAHASLIQVNGDFEADSSLVPNPGDTASTLPSGWEYDDYYGYGVQPKLMNVSAIGNGAGGTVGVRFPNWNRDGGWDAAILQKGPLITAGSYELTTTFTGLGTMGDHDKIKFNVYWIENLLDPWSSYGKLTGNSWVELSSDDRGEWQTQTSSFTVDANSAGVGNYFATWVQVQNNTGRIIVGEASLSRISVPEPAILLLLVTGLLGLAMSRRDCIPGLRLR